MAMERQMEVIANNLANMNSTGYKTESVLFEEYLETTPEGDSISYVRDYGTSRDLAEGEFTPTENPMDIAITKGGYLAEITSLITAQRAYEMNSRVITASDEMLRTMANLR